MIRALLRLARTRTGGQLVRLWLRHAPGAFPVRRLVHSDSLLAFRHPAPAYEVHILMIPLPPRAGLQSVNDSEADLFSAVYRAARTLAADLHLKPGWRLVANAGRFQEVSVLHFHLIS